MSIAACLSRLRRLPEDQSGVAFIEFAYTLPVFVLFAMGALELTHYVTTRMRVSQVALHIADHAARLGEGSMLAAQTLSEKQINDVLTGAGVQAGELGLYTNGKVVITNVEPMATPTNPTDRYKITWQRCRGSQTYAPAYGTTGQTNMTGIGPTGRQVKVPNESATIFVEVFYSYRPLISSTYAGTNLTFTEIASMTVRDRRDLTQIYNTEAETVSSCT